MDYAQKVPKPRRRESAAGYEEGQSEQQSYSRQATEQHYYPEVELAQDQEEDMLVDQDGYPQGNHQYFNEGSTGQDGYNLN